ncbi:DUF1257 domain-containing protein [Candidatus Synechococcus calcipolaris G9]|uniref:DUF1257 domain-containing protein n=1 Tax=Candidatus Synechococcus calcipolaris G9 TaxID=1497997 RepID=A0ABT6EVE6_9SYNE|nr:DUF1257 domain-containing protein [Candidatus Synechococcus calcipolaris]MDG2989509.1 DUF1257 domain-containing protein [Candidatus Synechococcus calcipolaris G9]
MSHFSQIKTQIRSLPALEAALNDLGLSWKPGPQEIRGFRGQTDTAQVVMPQDNGYDVGFRWNGTEYELVADLDFWQQAWSVDRFINKVSQRYAYHAVVQSASAQGFQVSEEQQQADGSVRLVVQRWR